MASQSFNQKKKDLTSRWLNENGYKYEEKREGFIAFKNSTNPILIKSFGRERSIANQDTQFTLKRNDFEKHTVQANNLNCVDLVYSLYLERPTGSYQLIIKCDFLKKEFTNYATINFNTQDFSYFKSQGIKVISVPK
ncbi:hypothetical protein ACH6EH_17115 [Paenibacillus sp. JSM ZJ436]|uniref:hypothetical protein n=1 Tax=Paenibacillus sp. JSM ZJ436 TaxID=3376190 RepID=UPI0037B856A5